MLRQLVVNPSAAIKRTRESDSSAMIIAGSPLSFFGSDVIAPPDPDAERATSAARSLRELACKLESRNLGLLGAKPIRAISAAAHLLADANCPPSAADTDALIESLTIGIKQQLAPK